MERNCSTCAYKEGSCYPSITIFDKDKTCKSYNPDYEGYIADLEKQLTKAKELLREIIDTPLYSIKWVVSCMRMKGIPNWLKKQSNS